MTLPPFEQVVADHGAVVLRVCRAVLGPDDAEDAWSETFLAALRAYPRLRPGSDVRAWLITIAHRKAIDGYRRNRRAPRPVGSLPEDATPVDAAPAARAGAGAGAAGGAGAGPGPGLGEEPLDPALLEAVDALPAKQRQVVAYRYLADLSYADIAALVGGTDTAARRSAADGIATLRRTYTPEETS